MLSSNQAVIIDVRTLEEYTFVGSPSLEPEGDPIAFLIPWKIFKGVDEEGEKKLITNSDFSELVELMDIRDILAGLKTDLKI